MAGRKKSVITNMFWGIGYYVVVMLLGFLAPRYIILKYGSEVNGLTSTITQVLNVIMLLQAGAATAAIYSLYKPIAENDYNAIGEKIDVCGRFFRKISYVFIVIAVGVILFETFNIKSTLDRKSIFIAFLIMGIKSFFDLRFTSKFRVVFTAFQKGFIVSIATLIEQIVYYAIVFIIIAINAHYLFLYLGLLIGSVIKIICLKLFYNKYYKSIIPKIKSNSKEKINGRQYSLINEISHSIAYSSMAIIISSVNGLTEASVFAVYALVGSALDLIINAIYSAFAPSFGDLVAHNDTLAAKRVFYIFQIGITMIGTFMMMCMTFLIIPFVKIYTSNVVDANYLNILLAILMPLMYLASLYRIPYNVMVSSYGYFKETWIQPAITLVFTLGISIGLSFVRFELVLIGPMIFYLTNFLYQHFKLKNMQPEIVTNKAFIIIGVSLVGESLAILACLYIDVREGIGAFFVYAIVFAIIAAVYLFLISFICFRKEVMTILLHIKKMIRGANG